MDKWIKESQGMGSAETSWKISRNKRQYVASFLLEGVALQRTVASEAAKLE